MFGDLSVAQAAEHLNIKEPTFRRLLKDGKGPKGRKEGRAIRFLPETLNAWAEDYKKAAYSDTATGATKAKAKRSKIDPLA